MLIGSEDNDAEENDIELDDANDVVVGELLETTFKLCKVFFELVIVIE